MNRSPHSDTTTEGFRVHAAAQYLPHESEPEARHHVFGYRITLTNVGAPTARLLSRHWIIVDSDGGREEVRGRGVVGEHPRLALGESYSYTSYCPLPTTWGTMEGSYTFARDDGSRFQVKVDRFFLVPSAPPLQVESTSRG